jgi:ornithine cyclodeaminase
MKFLSAEDLRALLDLPALIDFMAARHRQPKGEMADILIGPPEARHLVRSATLQDMLGTKLVTIVPGNLDRGLASVQALMVVFDRATGVPLAVLDATEMTYWKTAADSALGSRILSRPNANSLLICGAGGLAPWLARAHLAVRPSIRRVAIWNRTPERARHLAEALGAEFGRAVEVADALQPAVSEADIISTATMAREPFLLGAWLRPGQHVDLVGSYGPDTREADDECVRRARVFVDSREAALHGVGDILSAIGTGALGPDEILGDHYELAAGVPGRTSDDDITMFKNAGGAHLDLMTAAFFLSRLGLTKPEISGGERGL